MPELIGNTVINMGLGVVAFIAAVFGALLVLGLTGYWNSTIGEMGWGKILGVAAVPICYLSGFAVREIMF